MTATACTAVLTGSEREQKITQAAHLRDTGEKWSDVLDAVGVDRGAARFMQDVREHMREGRRSKTRDLVRSVGADGTRQEHGGERASDTTWTPDAEFVSADSRRDALRQYLGTTWQARRVYVTAPTKTRTVVACGDWHGNMDEAILAALIEAQADTYIVGGDAFDQAYASSWSPNTPGEAAENAEHTFRQEGANNRATLETLMDNTSAQFLIFLGNHDVRAWRAAYDALPSFILYHWKDPFDMLLHGFGERARVVGHAVEYHFPDGHIQDTKHNDEYIFVYGDVLLSHMNFAGGATETGVSKIWRNWFGEWRLPLGVDHVRMIVHFHVHARNLHSRAGGHMLLVEPGMCGAVTTENYKLGYNGKWKPGVQGFVKFVQHKDDNDWRTDLASVELVAPRVARGG